MAAALAGIYSLVLDPAEPRTTGPTIVDNISGMYACNGILGALLNRATTNIGCRIETNMLEAAISFIPDPFANHTMLGIDNGPRTRVATSQSFALRCSDGKLIAIHLSSPVKFWESMTTAIGRRDLLSDSRFAARLGRVEIFDLLERELAKTFATKPRLEWMKLLDDHDVPFAPVQSISEVLTDPQVEHLGTFYEAQHPIQGPTVGINPPIWINGARDHPHLAPPTLGEHSEELLLECGYSSSKIASLKAEKAV